MNSKIENSKVMNCKDCQSVLPDLLLKAPMPPVESTKSAESDAARNAAARAHLAICIACARELASLEATFALLDSWSAPEVSPYFNQKLAVRLREEQASPAPGWYERLRTRLLLNTGRQFRPALATALAVVLLIGGGSFGISSFSHSTPAVQPSATVKDLLILDKNEQALQQMDQLLQDDGADDSNAARPPAKLDPLLARDAVWQRANAVHRQKVTKDSCVCNLTH